MKIKGFQQFNKRLGILHQVGALPVARVLSRGDVTVSAGDGSHAGAAPGLHIPLMIAHIECLFRRQSQLLAGQQQGFGVRLDAAHLFGADQAGTALGQPPDFPEWGG